MMEVTWTDNRIQGLCYVGMQPCDSVSVRYSLDREVSTGSEVEPEGALGDEGRRGAGSLGLVGVRFEGSFPAIS